MVCFFLLSSSSQNLRIKTLNYGATAHISTHHAHTALQAPLETLIKVSGVALSLSLFKTFEKMLRGSFVVV